MRRFTTLCTVETKSILIPEGILEEENLLEKEPDLLADDAFFEGLDQRILQVMTDAARKAIHLHGPLKFSPEPAGLIGPRFFNDWRESECPDEEGLLFQGELNEDGSRHGRLILLVPG